MFAANNASPLPFEGGQAPSKKKSSRRVATRFQVKSACSNCKRRHAGCDYGRPCARCIKTGKIDTCRDMIDMRTKKAKEQLGLVPKFKDSTGPVSGPRGTTFIIPRHVAAEINAAAKLQEPDMESVTERGSFSTSGASLSPRSSLSFPIGGGVAKHSLDASYATSPKYVAYYQTGDEPLRSPSRDDSSALQLSFRLDNFPPDHLALGMVPPPQARLNQHRVPDPVAGSGEGSEDERGNQGLIEPLFARYSDVAAVAMDYLEQCPVKAEWDTMDGNIIAAGFGGEPCSDLGRSFLADGDAMETEVALPVDPASGIDAAAVASAFY